MGKLVLYLADGNTMDVLLDRERITIGRRADNDVCLPYPAVSGEHAQVVTILADSFLEDLGSTNGTLVNGKAVTKHFLSDHDQIDIGRQRLTYMSDNAAKVDALPPDLLRHQLRGLSEKVEPARALPQVDVPLPGDRRPHSATRGMLIADLEREERASRSAEGPPSKIRSSRGPSSKIRMPDGPPSKMRTPEGPPSRTRTSGGPSSTLRIPGGQSPRVRAPARGTAQPAPAMTAAAPAKAAIPRQPRAIVLESDAPAVPLPEPSGPMVRVLSGPSIGRKVPFPNSELTVGRVGIQVAVVRKVGSGYRLVPVEGSMPPRINGAPVAPDGAALHPGDTFEVAGVRLELSTDG